MTSERKLSSPFMSKYEYAVVLGRRAEQIALGATPMVKLTAEDRDPLSIAKRELDVTMIDVFIFFFISLLFIYQRTKKKTYRKESFLAQFGVFLEKRVISRSTCFFFRSCARLVLFCKKKKRSSNFHV